MFEVQKADKRDVVTTESQRAMQEVQAAMVVARRFPRDIDEAWLRIKRECSRIGLAEQAEYAYPRGGAKVTGPSIRLAEVLIRQWGNADYGIRELSQSDGESEVQAYCWDLESNVRQSKTFKVPHKRKARDEYQSLTDPRDIYEHVANMGARRLRACILGIIPGDIVDAAVAQCRSTLAGNSKEPLEDRVRKMLEAFTEFGVDKAMIERRLGHKVNAMHEKQLLDLRQIYTSLKDGMSKREDWFKVDLAFQSEDSEDLTARLQATASDAANILPTNPTEATNTADAVAPPTTTSDLRKWLEAQDDKIVKEAMSRCKMARFPSAKESLEILASKVSDILAISG